MVELSRKMIISCSGRMKKRTTFNSKKTLSYSLNSKKSNLCLLNRRLAFAVLKPLIQLYALMQAPCRTLILALKLI